MPLLCGLVTVLVGAVLTAPASVAADPVRVTGVVSSNHDDPVSGSVVFYAAPHDGEQEPAAEAFVDDDGAYEVDLVPGRYLVLVVFRTGTIRHEIFSTVDVTPTETIHNFGSGVFPVTVSVLNSQGQPILADLELSCFQQNGEENPPDYRFVDSRATLQVADRLGIPARPAVHPVCRVGR